MTQWDVESPVMQVLSPRPSSSQPSSRSKQEFQSCHMRSRDGCGTSGTSLQPSLCSCRATETKGRQDLGPVQGKVWLLCRGQGKDRFIKAPHFQLSPHTFSSFLLSAFPLRATGQLWLIRIQWLLLGQDPRCVHLPGKSPTLSVQPRGSKATAEIRRWLKPWQSPSSFLQELETGIASDSITTQSGLSFPFPLAALGKTGSPFGSLQPQPLSQSPCPLFTGSCSSFPLGMSSVALGILLSWGKLQVPKGLLHSPSEQPRTLPREEVSE